MAGGRLARGLHHVGLFARDIDHSIRFYRAAFGLDVALEWQATSGIGGLRFPGRGVMLRSDDGTFVEIFPADADAPPQDFPGRGTNHVCFRAVDCASSYARALSAGAEPYVPARVRAKGIPWDGSPIKMTLHGEHDVVITIAYLKGPDGEIIELLQGDIP